ncbi:MAG: GPW/gp25 family protein [Bryobacteraceae bacterium]|nr:GPW/gp25 family protein [Bryobacteraceae bacterium]
MNGAYRAVEFVHPDFGRKAGDVGLPAEETGLRLGPNGTLSMVEGDRSVRQAILILLTTRPGERVMRPDYGCLLHTLVFSPNDETTAGLAIHYVRQALERWEPRVRILDLDAGRNPEQEEQLNIYLEYRVLATNRIERMILPISLEGGER